MIHPQFGQSVRMRSCRPCVENSSNNAGLTTVIETLSMVFFGVRGLMKAGELRVQGDMEPEATCAAGATPVSGVYGCAYKATLNSPARERLNKAVIIQTRRDHSNGCALSGCA